MRVSVQETYLKTRADWKSILAITIVWNGMQYWTYPKKPSHCYSHTYLGTCPGHLAMQLIPKIQIPDWNQCRARTRSSVLKSWQLLMWCTTQIVKVVKLKATQPFFHGVRSEELEASWNMAFPNTIGLFTTFGICSTVCCLILDQLRVFRKWDGQLQHRRAEPGWGNCGIAFRVVLELCKKVLRIVERGPVALVEEDCGRN